MANEANNVTLNTNFNVAPYYDDFDETKNYHRILFRPGLAVQARELTQMQTILQNQIDRFAEHIFREGTKVRGFEMTYDQEYYYVKIRDNNSTGSSVSLSNLLNKTLKGSVSGVQAIVLNTAAGSEANTPNFKTLFVKYTAANTSGAKFFANNEILTATDGSGLSCNTITAALGGATGAGVAVKFNSGIVYAKDHFIRVPEQTVVISKYSRYPSARVGFDITESIITEVTDTTLLDPAQGSYNYAAPGAARLKLEVNIISQNLTSTVSNTFTELMQVKNGVVQSISNRTQYAQIRDYMAARTYDESGDYIVKGMGIRIQEHLKSGNNGGFYTAAEGGDSTKLVATVEPGKAYAKGYDSEFIVSQRIDIDKATNYESIESAVALAQYGNYVIVDNVSGSFDLDGQTTVSLRDTQANSVSTTTYSTTTFPGTHIGRARVKGFEYYSGTPGAPNAKWKIYLSDIQMNAGKSFANVQFIGYNAGSGQANGHADIELSNGYNANVKDPSFNRSIFRLPSSSIKTLRDTGGSIDNTFKFYKSYNITFNTSGQATINTTDSSETFDGSGALNSDAIRSDFYVVARGTANTSPLSGTISLSGNTVTGTSTAFTAELNVGDVISTTGSDSFVVSEVSSSSSAKVLGSGHSATGAYHKRIIQGQVLDLAGLGGAGSRGITISGTPSTTAVFDINENLSTTLNAKVIAQHNKVDGQEASKTVVRNRIVQINTSSHSAALTGPWTLGLSDGFKLVSVRKKNGGVFASTSEGSDVTQYFTLDSGATDNYYDHAKLVMKSGYSLSSGDYLLVTFDHFTHSYNSDCNYFTVDSYPVDDATAGTDSSKIYTYEIPIHISKITGSGFDLRNCIDFRPRISDTATSTSTIGTVSTNPATSTSVDTPTGGLRFSPPNQNFSADLDYYLSRRDVISLSREGTFIVTKGTASLKPDTPNVNEDMMPLASITLAPYPSLPFEQARRANRPDLSNVLKLAKNKRYTMKDIGQIASRIDRLEYQASLNSIEADTKNLSILDENGLDRFKNGFFADNFTGHGIGNVHDLDYKISIDTKKGEMRPLFELENTELFYDASRSQNMVRTNVTTSGVSRDQRVTVSISSGSFVVGETVTSGSTTAIIRKIGPGTSSRRLYVEDATGNFVVSASITGAGGASGTISEVVATTPGELLTLPYSHKVLVDQPYATTTRNCAGTFWSFRGQLELSPDSDYWYDTQERPDVNINIDMNTDNWLFLANSWQTDWTAWETSWTGQPSLVSSTETPVGPQRFIGTGSTGPTQIDGSSWFQQTDFFDIEQTFITENIFSTPITQIRSGTRDVVSVVEERQSYGNFVRDVNINPFMRQRLIFGKLSGMKPSSRLFGFFDSVDVNKYITPLTSSEYNSRLKTSSGAPVSPASTVNDQLLSDSNGDAYFVFELPNNREIKFRTGTKRMRFSDSPTNESVIGRVTTSAETEYTSEGLTVGQSELSVTTRKPVIGQVSLSDTRHSSFTTTNTTSETRIVGSFETTRSWEMPDPIAQSFLIAGRLVSPNSTTSGVYLTKIDLFFATKHPRLGITIELRELDPLTSHITNKVVPFSRVTLSSSSVNVSTDGSAATPVYFHSPIYIKDGSEYAVVTIPDAVNPNYSVFTAVLGDRDLISGARVTSQPATGFMWTSANDRTWVPVEEEDMKFTAYYAEFDKSASSYAVMRNEPRDIMVITDQTGGLLRRPGEVIHGETLLTGTFANTVLFAANVASSNCFVQGMTSGATGTVTSFGASAVSVRNVSTGAKFAGGEAVRFRLGANATHSPISGNSTGGITAATTPVGRMIQRDTVNYANTRLYVGNTSYVNSGAACTSNRMFKSGMWIKGQANSYQALISSLVNIKADDLYVQTQMILPSNTNITADMKMATSTSARDSSYTAININRSNIFRTPRYILSRSVESNTSASSATMASLGSIEIKYTYDCKNILASPAIDLKRISTTTRNNLLSTNASIGTSEDWVTNGGDSSSRYISRTINLADGQDAEDVRVYLTGYKPSGSDIHVYAKVLHAEDSDTLADAKWIPMARNTDEGFTATAVYSSSENRNDFKEFVFDMPSFNSTYGAGANTSNDNVFEYRNTSGARFVGFKRFAIKVVLTGSNSTNPPRVRDLRAIALQR